MLADVEQRLARRLGRGVDGGHGQRELRGGVVGVEVARLGDLVHPAEGISRLRRLLARGQCLLDDGLALLHYGRYQDFCVFHGLASTLGLRQKPVRDGAHQGRGSPHDEGGRERVHSIGLRNVQPSLVPAQLLSEEDSG